MFDSPVLFFPILGAARPKMIPLSLYPVGGGADSEALAGKAVVSPPPPQ